MENKKQLGGKRKGAGRKPVLSKKKQVSLYVEGSKIIKFGNEEKMKDHLYGVIDGFGKEDELKKEITFEYAKPNATSFDGAAASRVLIDEQSQWQEVKSQITGLPPKLSDFDNFSAELKVAKSRREVEEIMKRSVGGIMFPRERIDLKAVADEVLENMFND